MQHIHIEKDQFREEVVVTFVKIRSGMIVQVLALSKSSNK